MVIYEQALEYKIYIYAVIKWKNKRAIKNAITTTLLGFELGVFIISYWFANSVTALPSKLVISFAFICLQ